MCVPACLHHQPLRSQKSALLPSAIQSSTSDGETQFSSPTNSSPPGTPQRVMLGIPIAWGRGLELTFDLIFLSCRLTLDLSFFKKSGLLFDFIISGKKQKRKR